MTTMQPTQDQPRRAYVHHAEAFYAADVPARDGAIDDVFFGLYGDHGPTVECRAAWIDLGDYGTSVRIEMFDDTWKLFSLMLDVFQALAAVDKPGGEPPISPEQFCALLKSLGFEDQTP